MVSLRKSQTVLLLVLAGLMVVPQQAVARPKPLEGPIPAFVERVIDGDTIIVRARIWLGQELRVLVRINGIDTPELKSRCTAERQLALSARYFVKRLVGQRKVSLSRIRQGKYAGRVIAEVTDKNGLLLSSQLLKANLARPYKRGKRASWCKQKSPAPSNDQLIGSLARSSPKTVAP